MRKNFDNAIKLKIRGWVAQNGCTFWAFLDRVLQPEACAENALSETTFGSFSGSAEPPELKQVAGFSWSFLFETYLKHFGLDTVAVHPAEQPQSVDDGDAGKAEESRAKKVHVIFVCVAAMLPNISKHVALMRHSASASRDMKAFSVVMMDALAAQRERKQVVWVTRLSKLQCWIVALPKLVKSAAELDVTFEAAIKIVGEMDACRGFYQQLQKILTTIFPELVAALHSELNGVLNLMKNLYEVVKKIRPWHLQAGDLG